MNATSFLLQGWLLILVLCFDLRSEMLCAGNEWDTSNIPQHFISKPFEQHYYMVFAHYQILKCTHIVQPGS